MYAYYQGSVLDYRGPPRLSGSENLDAGSVSCWSGKGRSVRCYWAADPADSRLKQGWRRGLVGSKIVPLEQIEDDECGPQARRCSDRHTSSITTFRRQWDTL